jgi:hypothetical protein
MNLRQDNNYRVYPDFRGVQEKNRRSATKKLLLALALALTVVALMAGCARELEIDPPEVGKGVAAEIPLRDVERAVYNEITGSWMIPQSDPYTLENFQKACDDLASGESIQKLTRAEMAEFSGLERLKPTHYALRIYPKTEEEQWRVETMEEVGVEYAPLDYSGLTEAEVALVPQARRKIPSPFEKSPYTVTYDHTGSTDGGPTGPVTYHLPILYVVWPVEKPLPDDLEYRMDHEVFLPYKAPATRSAEYLSILEIEAIALAAESGTAHVIPMKRGAAREITGVLKTYDDVLKKNVPLANVTVRLRMGGAYSETCTDASGHFSIRRPVSFGGGPILHLLSFVFRDPQGRWKISAEDSSIPVLSMNVAVPGTPGSYSCGEIVVPPGEHQENEIHRAVNYFYNDQNVFPRYYPPTGLLITARSDYDWSSSGWMNITIHRDPQGNILLDKTLSTLHIGIFNNGRSDSDVIQTTLHEIGHAVHSLNSPDRWVETNSFLKESIASYVGWYLAQEYYKSLGRVSTGGNPSLVSNQARQDWTKTTNSTFGGYYNNGWYSPLFVDLTDDYNQKTSPSSSRPNDNISGISAPAVWSIISTSSDYRTEVREKIVNLAGTQPDFDEWIENFDDSPANNLR